MKKVVLIIVGIILSSLVTYLLLPPKIPISPLGQMPITKSQTQNSPYVVLGFAPYWNLKKINPESLKIITHFAYFALHLSGNGNITTHVNSREEEPGYTNYKRILESKDNYKNLTLTFMQYDEESLTSLLNSPSARQTAIQNINQKLLDANASGINIDFEPTGAITESLRNNFTSFITDLKNTLCPINSHSCPQLSISIYPSAAVRARIWDLKSLATLTDYFVVMTYDYTMPKSERAGPNSPLRDFSGEFDHSIIKNLQELTTFIPSQKILLGIPLYGYEWETVDSTKYSNTLGRGTTASLERIESMIADQSLEPVWDRNSLTAYGISINGKNSTQIYYENEVSIRLKLDLVRSSNLGGIALWALGYDNNVPWLWPTLSTLR